MNVLIRKRGRSGGHDAVLVDLTAREDRGVLYRIRAIAGTDAACPFVLTEYETGNAQVSGELDLSRNAITRLAGALERGPDRTRTVTNYDADDLQIAHSARLERYRFTDLAEDQTVDVFDHPETAGALAEALKIALHYFDRSTPSR